MYSSFVCMKGYNFIFNVRLSLTLRFHWQMFGQFKELLLSDYQQNLLMNESFIAKTNEHAEKMQSSSRRRNTELLRGNWLLIKTVTDQWVGVSGLIHPFLSQNLVHFVQKFDKYEQKISWIPYSGNYPANSL